ncbi:MAG: tetratricopeptide repeat protein [Acidobacteriota bacterium]
MRSTPSIPRDARLAVTAWGLLATALAIPAAAEDPPALKEVKVAAVNERIHCAAEPNYSYALYLPPGYGKGPPAPVLFVLDAAGRGVETLERFRPAAERYGWILASSWNSLSDEGSEGTPAAVAALVEDVERRFPFDRDRVYLTGMSGTSRLAWAFGMAMRPHTAGVIGVVGALPNRQAPPPEVGFAYFGTSGWFDYNYTEMRDLDAALDGVADAPHRFEFFDGGHQWAPEATLGRAVGWLELQAMRSGRRAKDPELIRELYDADRERAESLEAAEPLAALDLYRSMTEDYSGLLEAEALSASIEALERSPEVKQGRRLARRLVRQENAYRSALAEWVVTSRNASPLPLTHAKSRGILQIEPLGKLSRDDDPRIVRSAQRRLALAFGQAMHYFPEELWAQDEYKKAAASLEVAVEIAPEHGRAWYRLARAQVKAGDRSRALEALGEAVDHGYTDLAKIEGDPWLEPLRSTEGYRRALAALATTGSR